MKTVTITADMQLERAIEQAGQEELLLVRDGHAVAMITPIDDDDVYWHEREKSPEFIASIARARKQIATGQKVSHEELKRMLAADQKKLRSKASKKRR